MKVCGAECIGKILLNGAPILFDDENLTKKGCYQYHSMINLQTLTSQQVINSYLPFNNILPIHSAPQTFISILIVNLSCYDIDNNLFLLNFHRQKGWEPPQTN
jgi:hypothetical protein